MNKAHIDINWENYPSDETPLNERNLNKMDGSIDIIDDRVITLDTTKATKTEVATLVADVTFEESTGIITITKKNGSKITIDTQMEKIAINFDYNPITQQIILTLIDGTKQYIDLSALITQYEFHDSDTVAFYIDKDGKVSAIVKEGSIEEKHLEPNYLAKIKVEVAKAESSQQAAAKSEINAKASENAAKASETAAKTSETNAKASETAAAKSATAAAISETNAKASETSASQSAATATSEAASASQSASTAIDKATIATQKATEIIGKAESAADSATKAQSYAVGGTGSREGEDSDNAKYYYQQAKDVSEGLKGGLQPHGTVAFADLPALADVSTGWMFNISDEFTTTDDFKEGAGNVIPAGANIYKTSDEKWDVLAGTPVTGIKGVNEDSFRRGNVVLTAENVGAYDKDTLDKKLNDVQATKLWIKRLGTSDANDNPTTAVCQSVFYEYPPDSLNIPDANWYHILTSQSADAFYRTQFALSMTGAPNLAFRNFVGGSWNSWRNVLTTAGGTITGNISTNGGATFATDGNVYLNSNGYKDWLTNILNSKLSTSASCNKNWNWVGKGGQPTWLWGGELPNDVYVYNPSNFSVAYARDTAGVIAGAGDVRVGFSGDGVNFRTYNKAGTAAVNGYTNLGSGNYRWKQLFATTATISTSDRNLKKDIHQLTDTHLDFFLKLQPVSFLFKDGESGRTHIGFIAQDVEQAMSECGLTDLDFAGFCKDQKVEVFFEEDENGDKIEKERPILDENGNPEYIYSLRYEEFIALNTAMIQKLWQRVDDIEKENAEMREQIKSMQQDIAELKKSRV